MTLILAMANSDLTLQVSDRQFTDAKGEPCVLPKNKATLLSLQDARLVCGFAGLARAGGFNPGWWVTEALQKAADPDHLAKPTVERFTQALTERFRKRDLQSVPAENRRFTVMMTGYLDSVPPPNQIAALVTNYQDFSESQRDDLVAWDEFRTLYLNVKEDADPRAVTYLQRIGRWDALPPDAPEMEHARKALADHREPKTLVDIGVGIVRQAAGRPVTGGTVGKDLSAAIVPAARPAELDLIEEGLQTSYHPEGSSDVIYGVNHVTSIPGWGVSIFDPKMGVVDEGQTRKPLLVQKVGRNKLCPCESGKKYKKCCGQ